MELMEAISGRRSVRDYFPECPPQEALLRVIGAAIHAPNAVNRQPWFLWPFATRPCSIEYSGSPRLT